MLVETEFSRPRLLSLETCLFALQFRSYGKTGGPMTDGERFLFETTGMLIIPDALSSQEVRRPSFCTCSEVPDPHSFFVESTYQVPHMLSVARSLGGRVSGCIGAATLQPQVH